jgi:hypothetical protein
VAPIVVVLPSGIIDIPPPVGRPVWLVWGWGHTVGVLKNQTPTPGCEVVKSRCLGCCLGLRSGPSGLVDPAGAGRACCVVRGWCGVVV